MKVQRTARRIRTGFTLVELLMVIAIIAALIELPLHAVEKARDSANRISCASNLNQVGLEVLNYESEHKYLPSCEEDTGYSIGTALGVTTPNICDLSGPGYPSAFGASVVNGTTCVQAVGQTTFEVQSCSLTTCPMSKPATRWAARAPQASRSFTTTTSPTTT